MTRKIIGLALLSILPCLGQEAAGELSHEKQEDEHYRKVIMEAGVSPVDNTSALERHLKQFPNAPRRSDIERSILKSAMETRDNPRIVLYGERVLVREPDNIQILEWVSRSLLASDDTASAEKALKYGRHYESALKQLEQAKPPSGPARVRMREQLDTSLGKALIYQSRASGNLGRLEEAVELARRSYRVNPISESAREIGRWLTRLDREEEALGHYAEAFSIAGPGNVERLRDRDRALLKELYLKHHDSETGLGDLILEAYDRTLALREQRQLALKQLDPNLDVTDPMEFTLSGLDGSKLRMSTLRGKIVILDFWATWCRPCRAQQPLYEEVVKKYQDRTDVVFLHINTDEDREVVGPFLEKNQWGKTVYFEDGLQRLLQISSIPTTIVFDACGEVTSRMDGFIPHLFVDMLSERIDRALAQE